MSGAQTKKPRLSKLVSLILTIIVFTLAGPPFAAVAFWLGLIAMQLFSGSLPPLELLLGVVIIIYLSYLIGTAFAAVSGIIVAGAGVWLRRNNILAAVAAGLLSYGIIILVGQMSFVSALLGTPNMFTDDLINLAYIFAPLCVISSICCWFISRPIVRASWQSA